MSQQRSAGAAFRPATSMRGPGYLTVTMLLVGWALTGCGSSSPAAIPAEQLPPGTAHLRVNGQDVAVQHHIRCHSEQFYTTVEVGDDSAGLAAVVRNASAPAVESVQIRNVAGFTGSFWTGLGGEATVTINGPVLTVRGTADGFKADEPSRRVTGTFDLTAAC
jgi:ipoprotein LpqH